MTEKLQLGIFNICLNIPSGNLFIFRCSSVWRIELKYRASFPYKKKKKQKNKKKAKYISEADFTNFVEIFQHLVLKYFKVPIVPEGKFSHGTILWFYVLKLWIMFNNLSLSPIIPLSLNLLSNLISCNTVLNIN